MILHKFAASPFASSTLHDALDKIAPEDSIILTLDAVYACLQSSLLDNLLATTGKLYIIQDDLHARGLTLNDMPASAIDYPHLVTLVEQHHSVMSWD